MKKIIAVVGPTASGKSDFAVDLALRIGGAEVISADSRLVYKGFNIAAAKPGVNDMRGVRHHLIDVTEPETDFSAGLWEKMARAAIDDITSRGKTPIIAGGTGLYFRVLLENWQLADFEPDLDERARLQKLSNLELHDKLRNLDEAAALKINPADKKKLIRAIEIGGASKKPTVKEPEFDVEWIGLNFERAELYERIDRRVDLMIERGLVDETRALIAKHGRIKNITDTIGYKEILAHLDGELSLGQAAELLKKNTRNYAKRQLTWFRRNELINWNIYPERSGRL